MGNHLPISFNYLNLQQAMKKLNSNKSGDKKSGKKNTSLRLDKETLKALKIRAIEQETSIQNLIESLIIDFLSKTGKK